MSLQTLQNRLSSPHGLMVWLGGITILAILGRVSEGSSYAVFPDLGILLTAALSLLYPWHGLLALFPLGFALEPAPQGIGLRELGFAAICAAISLGTLKQAVDEGTLRWNLKRFAPVVIFLAAFLTLNFFVAMRNDISIGYWLRGLIPFLFVVLFWPIGILLGKAPGRLNWFAASLFIMAVLFCAQIMYVYWYEGLYEAFYYLPDNGNFIRTTPPVDPLNPGDKIGPFYYRVTNYLAQSTDALLPVAFSVGYVGSILAPNRKARWAFVLLTCLASTAIFTTQTRSMLLCALLAASFFGLALLFFQRRYFWRAVVTGVGIIVYSVIMVFAINLDPVWYNRALQLYYSLGINIYVDQFITFTGVVTDWVSATLVPLVDWGYGLICRFLSSVSCGDGFPWPWFGSTPDSEIPAPGLDPTVFSSDVNVLTRMEEYRIALGIFYDHPITGAGLGVHHEISFENSTGDYLVQQVGYVHNWVFYFLMVSGVVGAVAYAALLFVPPVVFGLRLWPQRKHLPTAELDRRILVFHMIWVGLLTLALYGLFFAVFRLITFNLLLAAAIGITFHMSLLARKGDY